MGRKKKATPEAPPEAPATPPTPPPAPAPAPEAPPATAGKGRKTCPLCGAVVGVRTRECACGHSFPIKTGGAASHKGSKSHDAGGSALDAAMFALTMGSVAAAVEAVREYEMDATGEFIASCGGTVAALELLETLQKPKF